MLWILFILQSTKLVQYELVSFSTRIYFYHLRVEITKSLNVNITMVGSIYYTPVIYPYYYNSVNTSKTVFGS